MQNGHQFVRKLDGMSAYDHWLHSDNCPSPDHRPDVERSVACACNCLCRCQQPEPKKRGRR
jgi:hypothetical protein